ncbi:unnamed protein product [Arctia plantaginis]|uniref:Secreted protein n=1 Tax=Arctia plantaginis TaxID=874455 RepID=A0A8S1BKE2_ARCPL|nr:unnamed protein product [Arctia plantaginis]
MFTKNKFMLNLIFSALAPTKTFRPVEPGFSVDRQSFRIGKKTKSVLCIPCQQTNTRDDEEKTHEKSSLNASR